MAAAVTSTYKRAPSPGGVPDHDDLKRVNDAIAAARQSPAGYNSTINAFVGEGQVIKSVREWNALKAMPADALGAEQIAAINQIAEAIWNIADGTPVTRVIALNGANGGIDMVQNGTSTMAGFFSRSSDVFDTTTTPQLIDRLRLDYQQTNFLPTSPVARIKTIANPDIVSSARIPRSAGFSNGHPNEDIISFVYPFSGKGVPASLDGHTLPEFSVASGLPPDQLPKMTVGTDGAGQPVTVMEFRLPDGSPYPQTINSQTASDWMLIVNPNNPDLFSWVPLP